jgi:hypothetical protein
VTFAISKQNSSNNSMSNKKQRFINKHHICHMQTPISTQVDDTSMSDLMAEVTALAENLTGTPPVKLTQVLIDTGCSKTLIKKQLYEKV